MVRAGREAADAFIALGANLGDRAATLRQAVRRLAQHPRLGVVAVSSVYETKAHTLRPEEVQPPYLNAVVHLRSLLPADALLAYCHVIEAEAGRRRRVRWSPRPLDLDLLVFGAETRRQEGLILPHPRLAERRFVLQPLAEVAPNLHVPPPFDATATELLARCPDPDVPVRTGERLLEPPQPS
jgi:2-amino-4-hydroxy-6-hydroxymethyldihydropteridine diphosphokinase